MYKKNTSFEVIPHFSMHKGFVILSLFFNLRKVFFEKNENENIYILKTWFSIKKHRIVKMAPKHYG
jgi:hypothetical protein